MIVSVAASAPAGPPVTGASSIRTCFAPSAAAIRTVACGAIVLMSMTVKPGFAPARTPSGPSSTSSTSEVAVTIVMTTSECDASSAAVEEKEAPASSSGAARSGRRAYTRSGYPASSRWSAIGRPITPRPMNPIFIIHLNRPRRHMCLCGSVARDREDLINWERRLAC